MKLIIDLNRAPNINRIELHDEFSFGQKEEDGFWDYQVGLDEWGKLALNFDLTTKECVSVEGYTTCKFRDFQNCELPVHGAQKCSLKMELSIDDSPEWGTTFLIPLSGRYIDWKNRRIQFGTPTGNSSLFQFGNGQYVYSSHGIIEAFLIEFDSAN
ncbi:MAG: hypothetical protein IJS52_10390 [Bacilli bacterium]|nr:hypothetical protein [Bacilli bacterium]